MTDTNGVIKLSANTDRMRSEDRMEKIVVLIPALNEEQSLPGVLKELGDITFNGAFIHEVIVCDNGSTDLTAQRALQAGATLVQEPKHGYGRACLAALSKVRHADIILFINADGAEDLTEAPRLIHEVLKGAQLAVGSRQLGLAEKGSLFMHQKAGNQFATKVINFLYQTQLTDLGPFRALNYQALKQLSMSDQDFGWIIEMQLKALDQGLSVIEVPVTTRKTIGPSKISGTFKGTFGASKKILWYLFIFSCKRLSHMLSQSFRHTKSTTLNQQRIASNDKH